MDHEKPPPSVILNGPRIGLALFVIVAGFFLWTEHRAHLLGTLPYLILLLCPLMHFFMHRNHGKGQGGGHDHHSAGNSGGTP